MIESVSRTVPHAVQPRPTWARLHGLTWAADREMPAWSPGCPSDVDITIRAAEHGTVPRVHPDGVILAEIPRSGDDGFWLAVTRSDRGYIARFPDAVDVAIDCGLREITTMRDQEIDPDIVDMLLCGTVSAFVLALRGHTVLHASAVERDGHALAILGQSGRGKSTVAAAFCAAGWSLVADDVLRVDAATGVTVHRGSGELRLREPAAAMVHRIAGASVRRTGDGRMAVLTRRSALHELPLSCIVIPTPDRATDRVQVRRLPGPEAMMALVRYPRTLGLRDARLLRDYFDATGDLAQRVPVLEVTVPWAMPLPPALADEVHEAVEATVA